MMTKDYVATVALDADAVQNALRGMNRRVDAISLSAASQGTRIAGMDRAVGDLTIQQSAASAQAALIYAQVNKCSASVGMLRNEVAGLARMLDAARLSQAETLVEVLQGQRRIIVLLLLAIGLSLFRLAT